MLASLRQMLEREVGEKRPDGGRGVVVLVAFALLALLPWVSAAGQDEPSVTQATERVRSELKTRTFHRERAAALFRESAAERLKALQVAQERGWPVERLRPDGGVAELAGLNPDGSPRYYSTLAENAAISTATDLVRQQAAFGSPDATGLHIGIWDGGLVRPTHQEFVGRVTSPDGTTSPDNHATLVAGIAAAAGVNASAQGMAPAALIDSYHFFDDLAEISDAARESPTQTDLPLVTNHSYQRGFRGWAQAFHDPAAAFRPFWNGSWDEPEDRGFGRYADFSAEIDRLCHEAPYFLPVWAAGNDRSLSFGNQGPQNPGDLFYRWDENIQEFVPERYDPAIHPEADPAINGGYDTLIPSAVAKNILSVGAVEDAVTASARNPGAALSTSFSSWGPPDDGRIKPDVVGNGRGVFSATAGSDTSYGSGSGTSYSSPNVAGSALLLQDVADHFAPGFVMRAASLRGLVLHTATDLGNPGPDYTFGWGLMDTFSAAEFLEAAFSSPPGAILEELEFTSAGDSYSLEVNCDGTRPLRATICWNDPPAPVSTALDDRTPKLINDLDIRVFDEFGVEVFPFVLDPDDPTAAAVTGDNFRDNVEQVLIESPAPGEYTVVAGIDKDPAGGRQEFTLLVDGFASITVPGGIASGTVGGEPIATSTISIIDVQMNEPDSGTAGYSVGLRATPPAAEGIAVNYTFSPSTAGVVADVVARSGTVVIPEGEDSAAIQVEIVGDLLVEGAEEFFIDLNVSGGPGLLERSRSSVTIAGSDEVPVFFSFGATATDYVKFQLERPGETLSVVAATVFANLRGGDFQGADESTFHAWNAATNQLLGIDTTGGTASLLGNAAPQEAGGAWTGLAWSDFEGAWYAVSTNGSVSTLYRVTISPFNVTILGEIEDIVEAAGLAADPVSERLYTVDRADGRLVLIDLDAVDGIPIGQLDIAPGTEPLDLDFFAPTRQLFLATWNETAGRAELYALDTTLAGAVLIGPIGAGDASVGAWATTGEPGVLGIAGWESY